MANLQTQLAESARLVQKINANKSHTRHYALELETTGIRLVVNSKDGVANAQVKWDEMHNLVTALALTLQVINEDVLLKELNATLKT